MKKILSITVLAIIVMIAFSSCKKDGNSTSAQVAALNTTAVQGKWRVTYFADNGIDETIHFIGYEFQFNSNNTVTATKGGITVSGTWASGNDDSAIKFILSFSSPVEFLDLNNDWHVTQQSSTKITLQDISGGGGGTDYLTFEKI
jgi:hypothetical protein